MLQRRVTSRFAHSFRTAVIAAAFSSVSLIACSPGPVCRFSVPVHPFATFCHTMSSSASSLPLGLSPLHDIAHHSPRVISILGQNPGVMTLQGTNTYLLGTGSHRVLLDTGEGKEEYTELVKKVLKEQKITQLTILLTHWHHDHTGGLQSICSLFSSAHQPSIHKYLGVELIPKQIVTAFPELKERVVRIEDGEEFRVEGATLKAIHTPGHTLDHCVFTLEEENAVLSGDTILGASTAVFQDLHAYMHSLRRIAACHPRRIYPAHGPIIDGQEAPERVEQYLAHRDQREKQILEALRSGEAQGASKDATERYPTAADLVAKICE
jgi:ribonuclease/clavin/mitogillin